VIRKCVVLVFCILAWLGSQQSSQAVPLSTLFQGTTITADDKLFSGWTLIDVQTVNGGLANFNQIDVTPLVDNPLNPGVQFSAPIGALGTPFAHQGPSSVHLVFSFNVQTTNQLPLIKDNSLLIDGYTFDAGPLATIQIGEEIFGVTGAPLGDKLAIVRNGDLPNNPNHFDSAQFNPTSFVHVVKTIDIQGPSTNDGVFLRRFEQRFSQVPEPPSLVLLLTAAGAAVLIWSRRARSSV
jgi:hypothetical protein